MNIRDAKEQIKNAIVAYFTRDEYGEYKIATEDQRPVFLMGPPGIGKTAIMQQIASELGVGLVSYSMTHHTRQSALGLPFITKKNYGGKEYSVSEYTMSEIIASVYDMMEETGVKEGILFLDEINCVSETLAPAMLQFLQYKIFGRHRVPDGWIVVTAGNPPEYNNSVREFDTVTWDRLKRIDIEPDYNIWKEYALDRGVHPSISTYLDIRTGDFYRVETTVEGKSIVTARAWLNLSDMIRLYEQNGISVDEKMVGQYLQDKKVSKSFANYYDLFNKYRSDYRVDDILSGKAGEDVKERAAGAKYDERLSLLGLLLDRTGGDLRQNYYDEQILIGEREIFSSIKSKLEDPAVSAAQLLDEVISLKHNELDTGKRANSLSDDRRRILHGTINDLDSVMKALAQAGDPSGSEAFEVIRKWFNTRRADYKDHVKGIDSELENMFTFAEDAFRDGHEMLIIVTELTKGFYSAHYISRHGCGKYFEHNMTEIQKRLFELQDEKYRDFQVKLIPTVDPATVIGVRTPELRKLAKELSKRDDIDAFLETLPHNHFDENQLHAFILSGMKDFTKCMTGVCGFLPFIDNWATCDQLSPKVFGKNKAELLAYINEWLQSDETYTIRFAAGMLMEHFLDDDFDIKYPEMVAAIESDEYYVNMMRAWYFATALAKQYDRVISFIEEKRLDKWTHNKTIQKSVESYRIAPEQKAYLKSLKIK